MPKNLLPVTHFTQVRQADCLAACAKMVLDYLGVNAEYDTLLKTLQIDPEFGAPASNILKLSRLNVRVVHSNGTLDDLRRFLEAGIPSIAFVDTGELPYWKERTGHAVVIVGIDDDKIYLNDPAFKIAPQIVFHGDFSLAWFEMGEFYTVITSK